MPDSFLFAGFGFSLGTWPISQAVVLVSDSINSKQIQLIGLPDGSLGLRIINSGVHEYYETDIIVADGGVKIVVTISYSSSGPSIRINGIDIGCAAAGSREKEIFKIHSQSAPFAEDLLMFSSDVPSYATHAEALFIRAIGDLAKAAKSNDWYVLLKSSADLRLLLLDGLLHKANERHRLKVDFCVAANAEPPPVDIDKLWNNIAPRDLPEKLLTTVNLDQLLRLRIFESKNGALTVKDVVRAAANADGGVHLGSPDRAEEGVVLMLDKEVTFFGHAASRQVLKDICKVVVAGSIPLIERIQGKS